MRVLSSFESWRFGRQRHIPRIPWSPENAHAPCPSNPEKGQADKAVGGQMTTFLGLR